MQLLVAARQVIVHFADRQSVVVQIVEIGGCQLGIQAPQINKIEAVVGAHTYGGMLIPPIRDHFRTDSEMSPLAASFAWSDALSNGNRLVCHRPAGR